MKFSADFCLPTSLFGYVVCDTYWLLLWSCLKLTTGCVDSGPLGKELGADHVRCCLWLTLGKLFGTKSDPQFVAASAGPECVQEGLSCVPSLTISSTGPRGNSSKFPKHPEIHLCLLLVSCLLGSVSKRATGWVGKTVLVVAGQASGKVVGVALTLETHDSVLDFALTLAVQTH